MDRPTPPANPTTDDHRPDPDAVELLKCIRILRARPDLRAQVLAADAES